MNENENGGIAAAVHEFELSGEFASATRHGNGHIHDTYCVRVDRGGAPVRFILQRVNTHIFTRTRELMENIERVTAHLAGCVQGEPDRERRALALIPTRSGENWRVDAQGAWWRMYRFIECARSVDQVESAEQC